MKYNDDQIIAWLRSETQVNKGMKELMNTYQERLYAQVFRIVKTHYETDDVLQNVFIKVYKNIKSFKGQSGLYTWIYRIATNEALTAIKKNKVLKMVHLEHEDVIPEQGQYSQMSSEDITSLLQKAITKLPEKQRSVFEMRYFDELTYKQISELNKTSVGALKASYHHAVKKIEDYILSMNLNYGV